MTIVVGFGPDARAGSGLDLAGQLARSTGDEVVLCCIVHDAFHSPAVRDFNAVDDDWSREVRAAANDTLTDAASRLTDLTVTTVVRTGRSVPQTLAEEGEKRGARVLVVGSSTEGLFGRISFGSASDRLVHSSRTPVAVAPRGYRPQQVPVTRLVMAVYPNENEIRLSTDAAAFASWLGVPVHLVTFASRDRSALGRFAAADVVRYWREQVSATQSEMANALEATGVEVTGTAIIEGEGWSDTMESFEWRPGDLLVVGSSAHGPVTQVFLGSTATRIVRRSPVPALLLPRR